MISYLISYSASFQMADRTCEPEAIEAAVIMLATMRRSRGSHLNAGNAGATRGPGVQHEMQEAGRLHSESCRTLRPTLRWTNSTSAAHPDPRRRRRPGSAASAWLSRPSPAVVTGLLPVSTPACRTDDGPRVSRVQLGRPRAPPRCDPDRPVGRPSLKGHSRGLTRTACAQVGRTDMARARGPRPGNTPRR